MPPRLFLLFTLLGLATAMAAPARLPTHAEIAATFRAIDTNGSGAIFPDEWRATSLALFAKLDKNHDGVIGSAELGDSPLIQDVLPTIEEKHQGKLTKDEFLELREAIFNEADIERAGYLTFAEYELLIVLQCTGWTDPNHHGRIEMSDLRTVLQQAFELLDVNHDGALTGDESAFLAPVHRAAMDPKNTGRITLEQLVNGYRFLLGADDVNRNLVPYSFP